MQVAPNGMKQFRTTIQVSYGMDVRSNSKRPVYPDMDHTDAHKTQIEDYEHERILPGIGDTQDVPGRADGEEVTETPEKSFTEKPSRRRYRQEEDNTGGNTDAPSDTGEVEDEPLFSFFDKK